MSAGHFTEHAGAAYGVLLVAVLATLSPLARGGKDDFPLSSYPMFSTAKDARAVVDQAVLVRTDGTEKILAPRDLGTDEVLQAEAILGAAVRGGKKASRALCETVAARLAARGEAGQAPMRAVEIRTVTYDSGTYLADPSLPPMKSVVRARCEAKAP
jgi:hypothetical protein